MHAMVLNAVGAPLECTELPDRLPGPGQIRLKVSVCGVCRTDIHVVDRELPNPRTPIIPGHEIVARIDAIGSGVADFRIGERVGVPWLGHTRGVCSCCRALALTAGGTKVWQGAKSDLEAKKPKLEIGKR